MALLGPLNLDAQSIVFSLAETQTLLALLRTSKSHAGHVRPHLLRSVSLSRDPDQVAHFQRFIVGHGLAYHIRELFIRRGAFHPKPPFRGPASAYVDRDPSEPEAVASALAEVLAHASNLHVLSIDKFAQDLFTLKPHLGLSLASCKHLTDLTLSDVNIDSLSSLDGLRGLRRLALAGCGASNNVIWHTYLPITTDSSLGTLILNSSLTLESLSLTGFELNPLFVDPTISFPRVRTIFYFNCVAELEDQGRAFPAARAVHVNPMFTKTTTPLAPNWVDLQSIRGPFSFVNIFRGCRTLRRLGIEYNDPLDEGPDGSAAELLLRQFGSENRLVSLSFCISDPATLSTVLEGILKETPELVFLEVLLTPTEPAHSGRVREMLVNPAPPSPLAFASNIKYLSVALYPRLFTWRTLSPDDPSPATRDGLAHNWMKALPNLRFMDVSLKLADWHRRVWRSAGAASPPQLLSRVDGGLMRSWYDSESWKDTL